MNEKTVSKLVSAQEYLESHAGKKAYLAGEHPVWTGAEVVSVEITEIGVVRSGVKKFELDDVHFIKE